MPPGGRMLIHRLSSVSFDRPRSNSSVFANAATWASSALTSSPKTGTRQGRSFERSIGGVAGIAVLRAPALAGVIVLRDRQAGGFEFAVEALGLRPRELRAVDLGHEERFDCGHGRALAPSPRHVKAIGRSAGLSCARTSCARTAFCRRLGLRRLLRCLRGSLRARLAGRRGRFSRSSRLRPRGAAGPLRSCASFPRHALSQSIHQVDDVGRFWRLGLRRGPAARLGLDQRRQAPSDSGPRISGGRNA